MVCPSEMASREECKALSFCLQQPRVNVYYQFIISHLWKKSHTLYLFSMCSLFFLMISVLVFTQYLSWNGFSRQQGACTDVVRGMPMHPSAKGQVRCKGISSVWGLPGKNFPTLYRRKTGKNSVSASSREMEFWKFSVFSVLNLENSKKIGKKYDKKLGVFLSK